MISVLLMLSATTVYRLELTDEKPYIVGEDGVRREVCLVDPEQYAMMTGKVDAVWRSMNETSEGRKSLHGRLTLQEIDKAAKTKTEVYADGYRHTFALESIRTTHRAVATNNVPKRIDRSISERQRLYREKMKEWRNAKPKTVTIEHDAVTGKDVVK